MFVVSIVGRPNVGKSSLFNRLVGRKEAIVDDCPGVTRDRLYGVATWKERSFYVVDTGGYLSEDSHPVMEGVRKQIRLAIAESDIVLLVIDGIEGPTLLDQDVADVLRQSGKQVLVVVNKIDDFKHENHVLDGYSLGFGDVIGVSAEHKRNIDELLDGIAGLLPAEEETPAEDGENAEIRVALVGRPNVGKSSLLNVLAGQERSIVSDKPGTTRDAVDTTFESEGCVFRLIDTAGLRRKSRVREDIEYYSFLRTMQAIDRSDVALLVMDATEPATDQDKKLASLVLEKGKGLVILLNKWDLLGRKDNDLGDRMKELVRDGMVFAKHAPVVFVSALTKRGLHKIFRVILSVFENRKRRISTNTLNRIIRDLLAFDRLPSDRNGRRLNIYYCTQSAVEPPTFVFFVNNATLVTPAFENHIENELREIADFQGAPIRFFWREKARE